MLERVNKILQNNQFKYHLEQNKLAEADRRFCRHNIEHFLDVARIAVIINEKEDLKVADELIYAAALLHDIGKHEQYSNKIPHEQASTEIAPTILEECGFEAKEQEIIIEAIKNHRNSSVKEEGNLNGLLYRADKASRACFTCDASKECNWSEEKKNLLLII